MGLVLKYRWFLKCPIKKKGPVQHERLSNQVRANFKLRQYPFQYRIPPVLFPTPSRKPTIFKWGSHNLHLVWRPENWAYGEISVLPASLAGQRNGWGVTMECEHARGSARK